MKYTTPDSIAAGSFFTIKRTAARGSLIAAVLFLFSDVSRITVLCTDAFRRRMIFIFPLLPFHLRNRRRSLHSHL